MAVNTNTDQHVNTNSNF